jgi:hypothetical protein
MRSRIGLENAESLTPEQLLDRYFVSKDAPRERIDALMQAAKKLME